MAEAFLRSKPTNFLLDARGYMSDPRHNLVEGVDFAVLEGDLLRGDGKELGGDGRRPAKFLAAHSSTALAVNVFRPFRKDCSALRVPWSGPISTLQFERKCPHGVGQGNPPNLDVLLEGRDGIVGIESKCLEMIGVHKAEFRPAYDMDLRGERRTTPWFREMQCLVSNPSAYIRLNAAQLVKHALGLEFSFPGRAITLAYLFWEPDNAVDYPIFAEHRAELKRFEMSVAGGGPSFVSMSYPELWKWWNELPARSSCLGRHIDRLQSRYSFALPLASQTLPGSS